VEKRGGRICLDGLNQTEREEMSIRVWTKGNRMVDIHNIIEWTVLANGTRQPGVKMMRRI
jgi:hypothetical protein